MSEQLEQLWQRFRGFPRAIQWAIIAGVGIVLFLIWNDYVLAIGNEWAMKADNIQADVRKVRESTAMNDDFRRRKLIIESLGPVEIPEDEDAASSALNKVINDLLGEFKNDITNKGFGRPGRDRLPKDSLPGIVGPNQAGMRLTGEWEFDCSPETATAILSRLESSPHIEAVSELRITKLGGRKVNVKLKLEAWMVEADTSRRL